MVSKVLQPIVYSLAGSGQLAKPVLVLTITDGEPTDTPRDMIVQVRQLAGHTLQKSCIKHLRLYTHSTMHADLLAACRVLWRELGVATYASRARLLLPVAACCCLHAGVTCVLQGGWQRWHRCGWPVVWSSCSWPSGWVYMHPVTH
jgi:hypothetical protein